MLKAVQAHILPPSLSQPTKPRALRPLRPVSRLNPGFVSAIVPQLPARSWRRPPRYGEGHPYCNQKMPRSKYRPRVLPMKALLDQIRRQEFYFDSSSVVLSTMVETNLFPSGGLHVYSDNLYSVGCASVYRNPGCVWRFASNQARAFFYLEDHYCFPR